MDDLTAYYAPPIHHPYYQPAPPPPPGTVHQHPTAVAHVQPQIVAYVPQIYPQSSQDQVRTLFVAGLPDDVKAREIYNLFRECPGYQSSNLRPPASSNSQPFAFATFVDQQSAVMALHTFNGMVFDLEKGSTLFIDLAKSNSRSKRLRADDESQGSEKRLKGSVTSSRSDDTSLGSIRTPGFVNSAYNTIGYPSTQRWKVDGEAKALPTFPILRICAKLMEYQWDFYEADGEEKGEYISSEGLLCAVQLILNSSLNQSRDRQSKNNTPCPTIFVANLGPTCTEEELMQVFSRCCGFLKLKMQSTYGAPVAFVDFQDTACSTEALSHLQGTILYSSTSGEGMRLEYAKSRMGMRSKKSR